MTESKQIDLDVLELLSSRICHDMISPISAINNGMELFEELGPDAGDEVTDLIAHAARTGARKLQMMRFAYGAGGNDPSIRPIEVFKAFEAPADEERRVELTYPSPDRQMPLMEAPGINRVLACILFMAQECMPRGGTIDLTCEPGKLSLTMEGIDEKLWDKACRKADTHTISPDDALNPKTIHPYVTGVFLRYYGYSLKLEAAEDGRASLDVFFPAAEQAVSQAV